MGNDPKTAEGPRTYDDSAMFHFSTNIADTALRDYRDFCIHIFCTKGTARLRLSEKEYNLEPTDCLVIINNSTLKWLETSPDFEMHSIAIANSYMGASASEASYYTIGMLSLMENPLVKMTDEEFKLCFDVCAAIRMRLTQHGHMFYKALVRKCVETLVLDIYNIRAHAQEGTRTGGNQAMRYFRQFINMLEDGRYRQEREVRWYATQLGITPKYLSEICMNSSNRGASYWINKFTTEEIARLLQNPTMSINSIGSLMSFKTRSYFSHYVKEHLGMTPKEYRESILGGK